MSTARPPSRVAPEDYDTLLGVIDDLGENTPLVPRSDMYTTATREAGLSYRTAIVAYREAKERDDVVWFHIDGRPYVARNTVESLQRIMAAENAKPDSERDAEFMDTLRDLIREVRDDE